MQDIKLIEKRALVAWLGTLAFLGAYLLFLIEPISGKIITPVLGGASEVWIICLLFYQLVVLAGYLLTYSLARLSGRKQRWIYIVLFAISLFWARVPAAKGWNVNVQGNLAWELLILLSYHLGIPCMILSSISGTVQIWQTTAGAVNPYKLYSLSNLGSFAALLMYPILIEPHLTVSSTLSIWEWLYIGLFLMALVSVLSIWRSTPTPDLTVAPAIASACIGSDEGRKLKKVMRWLFLSALGSAGLLSFSSYITADVCAVPLLWILPLSIYLLAYVIAFGNSAIKAPLFVNAWIPLVVFEPICMVISPVAALGINLVLLFLLCMVTSIELVASKPEARKLAGFYLALAAGSTFGSILVALVAPLCFSFSGERSVVMLIFTIYLFVGQEGLSKRRLIVRAIMSAVLIIALFWWLMCPAPGILHRERNFFGSVSIKHEGDMRTLYNGRVKHGQQYFDPDKGEIDAYPYGPPAALVFAYLHSVHAPEPIRVCVIGLGAGSMAVEAQQKDKLCFYEIDPKIESLAKNQFSYLAHSRADVSIQLGDGRLLLKNCQEKFDGICVDVFSGDAIPVHLLTTEAMEIYLQHLKPNGVLFFHVTNLYLDIASTVGNLAASHHLSGCELIYDKTVKYIAITPSHSTFSDLISFARKEGRHFSNTTVLPMPTRPELPVWTDNYSNLLSILKWHI